MIRIISYFVTKWWQRIGDGQIKIYTADNDHHQRNRRGEIVAVNLILSPALKYRSCFVRVVLVGPVYPKELSLNVLLGGLFNLIKLHFPVCRHRKFGRLYHLSSWLVCMLLRNLHIYLLLSSIVYVCDNRQTAHLNLVYLRPWVQINVCNFLKGKVIGLCNIEPCHIGGLCNHSWLNEIFCRNYYSFYQISVVYIMFCSIIHSYSNI